MTQGRECMVYHKSTFSGRAEYLPKCKCTQCCIIRSVKFNDLWENNRIRVRQLNKLFQGKNAKQEPKTDKRKDENSYLKATWYYLVRFIYIDRLNIIQCESVLSRLLSSSTRGRLWGYTVSDILDEPWSRLSPIVRRILTNWAGRVTRYADCIYDTPYDVRTRYHLP